MHCTNVRKSCRILVRPTQQHDARHHPIPQHRRRWLGCCHFCCWSPRISVINPCLRQSAVVRDSTRWPQCAVSMTFCQLVRWLWLWRLSKNSSSAMATRTRWRRTPCVWSSHHAAKERHQQVCTWYVWFGAATGRMKTSLTPWALRRSTRTDFRLPYVLTYPFFLDLLIQLIVNFLKGTPLLHQTPPEKKHSFFRSDERYEGSEFTIQSEK